MRQFLRDRVRVRQSYSIYPMEFRLHMVRVLSLSLLASSSSLYPTGEIPKHLGGGLSSYLQPNSIHPMSLS